MASASLFPFLIRSRGNEVVSGVIVVSVVSAERKVCIAYTSVLVNSGNFLDIRMSTDRWTKQLVPDIFSKSVPFVPSRGDSSKRRQILLI